MLEKLSIENYALIQHLEMELSGGLNIITGETGAGKSILLGALGLILGNRAEAGVLKDAGRNCVIEGTFRLGGLGLESFFDEHDIDYDATTVIRRIITPAGKSRAYVNDIPVGLPTLKELSARLIDIHSQNQSLLAADGQFRLRVIDSLAGSSAILSEYGAAYGAMRDKEQQLAFIRDSAERDRRDEEYLRFQWEQISALGLHAGELQELEAEQKALANAEEILESLSMADRLLEDDETGALPSLKAAADALRRIGGVLDGPEALAGRIHEAYVELKDIEAEISSMSGRTENDPARLATVDDRLGTIYALMQRHSVGSVEELMEIETQLRSRLDTIASVAEDIGSLEAEIEALRTEATAAASRLTDARRQAAAVFDSEVTAVLSQLGMAAARFVTEIRPAGRLTPTGADEAVFMFDANGRNALQPLEKTASGGETSRVMLALKSTVARHAKLPTIIFDEIDTGVSGPIADAMGSIIARLGESMQVVNITHLPQVASKGDTHFLVYKENRPDGTVTRIMLLDRERRVAEIAKMLSGSKVTDAAMQQARTLLGYE